MYRQRVSAARVIGHLILTCATGGLWLVVLAVRFMLANS